MVGMRDSDSLEARAEGMAPLKAATEGATSAHAPSICFVQQGTWTADEDSSFRFLTQHPRTEVVRTLQICDWP